MHVSCTKVMENQTCDATLECVYLCSSPSVCRIRSELLESTGGNNTTGIQSHLFTCVPHSCCSLRQQRAGRESSCLNWWRGKDVTPTENDGELFSPSSVHLHQHLLSHQKLKLKSENWVTRTCRGSRAGGLSLKSHRPREGNYCRETEDNLLFSGQFRTKSVSDMNHMTQKYQFSQQI